MSSLLGKELAVPKHNADFGGTQSSGCAINWWSIAQIIPPGCTWSFWLKMKTHAPLHKLHMGSYLRVPPLWLGIKKALECVWLLPQKYSQKVFSQRCSWSENIECTIFPLCLLYPCYKLAVLGGVPHCSKRLAPCVNCVGFLQHYLTELMGLVVNPHYQSPVSRCASGPRHNLSVWFQFIARVWYRGTYTYM